MMNNSEMKLNEEMLEKVTGGTKKPNKKRRMIYMVYGADGVVDIFYTTEDAEKFRNQHGGGTIIVHDLIHHQAYEYNL